MNTLKIYFLVTLLVTLFSCESGKKEITADYWDTSINFGWKFSKGDQHSAMDPGYDFSSWESIDLPHDWAISGPFDSLTAPGHTGKLPWKGEGWYSKSFDLPADANGKQLQFLFDGVMANPTIYLNGKKVGSWRYGYNSFWIDATDAALFGHKKYIGCSCQYP